MPMSDCPCCGPPWSFSYSKIRDRVLYAGGSGSGANNAAISKYNPDFGTPNSNLYAIPGGTQSIACDFNGNLYCASNAGGAGSIYAISPNGVLLWTASHSASGIVRGLAASLGGFLYSAGGDGVLKKWDLATGTQITSGWPYTNSGGGNFASVCVDQSDNVYVCGGVDASGKHVMSLSPSGSVRWTQTLANGSVTASQMTGLGIAIDGSASELAVAAQPIGISAGTIKTGFWFVPSTGSVAGSLVHGNSLICAAYNPAGIRYFGGAPNPSGYYLRRGTAQYYNPGPSTSVNCIAIGMEGNEYICHTVGTDTVRLISGAGWQKPIVGAGGNGTQSFSVECSLGRVGAFGMRY